MELTNLLNNEKVCGQFMIAEVMKNAVSKMIFKGKHTVGQLYIA